MPLQTHLDRVPLGDGPTPVRELMRLGASGGAAPVWIKDDGAYSRVGGNKARKLEWLLADARRRGKRTIVTGGGTGTNHGLATAVFARSLGMRTVLVLAPQPESDHVRTQLARLRASGAEIHLAPGFYSSFALGAWLAAASAGPGLRTPYLIPPGGSTPLGCVGYVRAALELRDQIAAGELPEPSHIVVALGSGGTAAGLLAGIRLAGMRSRLLCIEVSDAIRLEARSISRLARRTLRLLAKHGAAVPPVTTAGALKIERGWLGSGYGRSTPDSELAMEILRDREGVTLDPVYTSKAVAALLTLNAAGAFGEGPVLYWHTYTALEPDPTAPAAGRGRMTARPEGSREAEEAAGTC